MPKTDIGPKIGIDGEAEFRRQIAECSTALKTLGTEADLVASQFIGQEQSTEALTAANNTLGARIVKTTNKLELQREMMQRAAATYGEADARTQKLTQEYNKTETQLNKLTYEYEQNEKQIKENTEAQDKAGATAGTLSGLMKKFGLDLDSVGSKLGLSREQTSALSDALGGGGFGGAASLAIGAAAAAAAITLAAEAVKEITEFMTEAVSAATDYADNINTLSTNFHIATETLQEYQYMAELTDTSLDTITGSIQKLTRSMAEARKTGLSDTFLGSDYQTIGNAADAFARLGIQITDSSGQLRDANEVFLEAIDHLGYISNETERDALAMQIFGRSAMELNSLIATGKDSIAAYAEEARAMGYVLSDDQLAALQAVDDEFARFDREMEAIKNQIAAEMAPALLELAQQLLEVAQSIDWNEFGKNAATIIRDLTPLIVDATKAVADLAEGLANLGNAINGSAIGSAMKAGGKFATDSLLNSIPGVSTARSVLSTAGSLLGSISGATITLDGYALGQAATPYINSTNYSRGGIL